MGQFAEQEIVLPNGPFQGQRYRLARKPISRLWFEALDSRQWTYHVATGPTQSGKSLDCFVIPLLYCLFERQEDVILGLPDMKMSSSKWVKDILPVIMRTRYRELLPVAGKGSRGGLVEQVHFRHGCSLTFMSFGGGDKSRAGETTPNLIITETDGGGEAGEASKEANPIEQLIARTLAYDLRAFVVMECTVSTVDGQTWTRYQDGTASQIVRPCPLCGEWVSPERDHFVGWSGAANEIEAGNRARFHCPACGEAWSDAQRFEAGQHVRLIHKGQTIDRDGIVHGDSPPTRTLGFRWSAVDNPFRSSEMLASVEWRCENARDTDEEDKKARQFFWTLPWTDLTNIAALELDPLDLARNRIGDTSQNVVPSWCDSLTVGVDVGDHKIHWTAIAWGSDATSRVINYGILRVHSAVMGAERAIVRALQYLRDDVLSKGFPVQGASSTKFPDQVWVDAGWRAPKAIFPFLRETDQMDEWNRTWVGVLGRGSGKQFKQHVYSAPSGRRRGILWVGQDYYICRHLKERVHYAVVNADSWKSFVHQRLATPLKNEEGSRNEGVMDMFIPGGEDHREFFRHLTAEQEKRVFVPLKGESIVWEAMRKANHWFDSTCYAAAAARHCGVDLSGVQVEDYDSGADAPQSFVDDMSTPDGRRFYE